MSVIAGILASILGRKKEDSEQNKMQFTGQSRVPTGNVTGQQRMVHVQQQRQQFEYQLLTRRQRSHGPRQATAVDLEEARAQLRQHLAVDAVIDVRADFLGARHVLLKPGITASLPVVATTWQGTFRCIGRPSTEL